MTGSSARGADGGRLRFANQLRGVAAVSVAFSHLVGVYWLIPEAVTAVTFSDWRAMALPGVVRAVTYPWVNFGPLGVALFFLISGLVIPFSLEKHSRWSFMGARLLRVYPTYVVALGIEMAVLYGASLAWGRAFVWPWRVLLSNALLVYDVMGDASVDLVNWTLSVELKFYLLAVLLMPALRAGRAGVVIAAGAVIFVVNAAMGLGWIGDVTAPPSSVSYTISSHSLCLTYMLIGVLFNFHARGLLSTVRLSGGVILLGALFVGSWRMGVWAGQYPVVTVNYLWAGMIFAGLYWVRERVPANRVLDGMAAISFPFYVVHSLIGYSVLRMLTVGLGVGYYASLAVAVAVVVGMATGLHVLVERPTALAGQRLGSARQDRGGIVPGSR